MAKYFKSIDFYQLLKAQNIFETPLVIYTSMPNSTFFTQLPEKFSVSKSNHKLMLSVQEIPPIIGIIFILFLIIWSPLTSVTVKCYCANR